MHRATIALAFAVLVAPSSAQANCAAPVGYHAEVLATGSVVLCPDNFGQRDCTDAGGLLRQDVTTKELVKLGSSACKPGDGTVDDATGGSYEATLSGCYLDECVAPGTYRYGFAVPYECHSSSCGTYYYQEVTVPTPTEACTVTLAGAAPVVFTGTVPWKSTSKICDYGGLDDDDGILGCAMATPLTTQVVGIQLGALLLGLALWVLRRRKAGR